MQLHFNRKGQGEPVVLLHGLFGCHENLNSIARALSGDYDVIAIDLPNHGRSEHYDGFSYGKMADAVANLLQSLGLDSYHLIGHSMGGKVAMQLAIRSPEKVRKMVVVDIAPVQYQSKHAGILKALEALDLSTIASRKAADARLAESIEEPGIRGFLLKSLNLSEDTPRWRFNLQAILDFAPNISDGIEGHGSFEGPVLFVKGGKSSYIESSHRPAIMRYFPNSKAHVLSDAGHWLHAEKPEQFNRIVQRFLFA